MWHENLTDCPPHLSDVATVPWEMQKVIFNSIIHTYFWLFTLSQKKTICNPLSHPIWTNHHKNLWIAKLFHLTEGLLRSFKCWRLWKEPVVDCHQWLWKEPVVMCGNWNVRQAMSQQVYCIEWPPSALIHASSLFRHCSVAVLKFSPCRNKPLQQASTCPTRAPSVACSRRSTRAMQIIGSIKQGRSQDFEFRGLKPMASAER